MPTVKQFLLGNVGWAYSQKKRELMTPTWVSQKPRFKRLLISKMNYDVKTCILFRQEMIIGNLLSFQNCNSLTISCLYYIYITRVKFVDRRNKVS